MNRSARRSLNLALLLFAVPVAALLALAANPLAQTKAQLPARVGHINDFAGVVDEKTRQRLENLLEDLKLRSGIQFDIAILQSIGERDVFEVSRQLSSDWNVGARNTVTRSLLLVLAVDEKVSFTQFSRSVQGQLPEGVLGEIAQRMRGFIGAGQYSDGVQEGVQFFVNALAEKASFSPEGIGQQPPTAKVSDLPSSTISPAESVTPAPVGSEGKTNRAGDKTRARKGRKSQAQPAETPRVNTAEDDADEAEEVELTLTLPVNERVSKLKDFLAAHPESKAKGRALELLAGAYAGVGDQKLKTGDSSGGIEDLTQAIEVAPADAPEELFSEVISQIPLKLYARGERNAAFKIAQRIEAKFGETPKHLLALAGFYVGAEYGDEAIRLATKAVGLAPDMAEAHYVLASALHISLRLEEATTEYARSLKLDPKSENTRRRLADLNRAQGNAVAALALYREQLAIDPRDKAAQAGLVLSLLDADRFDEANQELAAALQSEPRNLPLLAGTAYWFAAHKKPERALELARKAVELEPRYVWSQIALARALLALKKPLEAERAIRFARQYGKFPTLDYELASVLTAAGLYEEAASLLTHTFSLQNGLIQTRLAGRVTAEADTFTSLLAPERRASVFQFTAADDPNSARILGALLRFALLVNPTENARIDAVTAAAAADEFASGDDEMRAYRQLYAAARLLRTGVALSKAYALAEAARNGLNDALGVPAVTVAVQAEEYYGIRAQAIASGSTPDVPEAPRNVLSNLLTGRIEDLSGWILFNQDRPAAAVEYLRRAVGILPENTPSWRAASWHLGAALDQAGRGEEALNYYIKSYNSGEPDTVRRSVIEQLYQRINGSLVGLDDKIGAAKVAENPTPAPTPTELPANSSTETASSSLDTTGSRPRRVTAVNTESTASPQASPVSEQADSVRLANEPAAKSQESVKSELIAAATPEATASPQKSASVPAAEKTDTSNSSAPPSEAATPSPSPTATETPSSSPSPTATETPSPSPSPTATETPSPSPADTPASVAPSPKATPSEPEVTEAAPPKSAPSSPEPTLADLPPKLPATVKVTGRVKQSDNDGIPNVVVVLISAGGTVLASTTDADGNYSFTVVPSRRGYRIIPSRDNYIFTPLDVVLDGLTEDKRGIDFVGSASRSP
jgi:predicted Zn-dependent protease